MSKNNHRKHTMNCTDPNDYKGCDIQRINAAVEDARKCGGIIVTAVSDTFKNE